MEFLQNLEKNAAPAENAFNDLLKKIDFKIDPEYIDFIKNHDGAEGFLNNDNYILLWKVEDLIALNPYYEHEPKCLNFFFIGSNGSSLGYAFDKHSKNVLAIDFYDIGDREPEVIANSFRLFINKLRLG